MKNEWTGLVVPVGKSKSKFLPPPCEKAGSAMAKMLGMKRRFKRLLSKLNKQDWICNIRERKKVMSTMSLRVMAETYEISIRILTKYGDQILDTSCLQGFAIQYLRRHFQGIIWVTFHSHQKSSYLLGNLQEF